METKRCYKCESVKLLTEFSCDKTRKDGHQAVCKDCFTLYRKENAEKAAIYNQAYYLKNKERLATHKWLYRKSNKNKIAIRDRAYYEKNKDAIARYYRVYYQSERGKLSSSKHCHKRRMQTRSILSNLTTEQWKRILQAQSDRCNMCGKSFCKSRKPTFDHIVPLSKGGGMTSENIQGLCLSCNSRKSNKLDLQFIQTWSK